MLQWSNLTEDKKIRLATQVARDAKRLSSLLNNLLELSTFPENKVNIKPQKIDLVSNLFLRTIIERPENLYFGSTPIFLRSEHLFSILKSELFPEVTETKMYF